MFFPTSGFILTDKLKFVFNALSIACAGLSMGCAAPMTEVVASRSADEIEQRLFVIGDEVWIDYQLTPYESGKRTLRGFVLETNDKSVKLDIGRGRRSVDIKYRWINTLSHPVDDRLYLGLSGGRFYVPVPVPQEFPVFERLVGLGIGLRRDTYKHAGWEWKVLVGGNRNGRFNSWINIQGDLYSAVIIPNIYIYIGFGNVISFPDKEYLEYHDSAYRPHRPPPLKRNFGYPRLGFGFTSDPSKPSRVRIDAGLLGLRMTIDWQI